MATKCECFTYKMGKRLTQIMVILIWVSHHPLHSCVVLLDRVLGIGGSAACGVLFNSTRNFVQFEGFIGNHETIAWRFLNLLQKDIILKRIYEDWTKTTVTNTRHFSPASFPVFSLLVWKPEIYTIQVICPKCPWPALKFPMWGQWIFQVPKMIFLLCNGFI